MLSRTAILQLFAAVQQQDGSVGAVPGKMPKILILLLESGQSWDFGSGQTGTVTAFPPNPSLQESNFLSRHTSSLMFLGLPQERSFSAQTLFSGNFIHAQ